jgi:glucose/mannose-6-phosphate isomerase
MERSLSAAILDALNDMHKVDQGNMLNFCVNAADNFRISAKNAEKIKLTFLAAPKNIVLAGMGGSAIGGELVKDYTRATVTVPIEISREYRLPAYANKNTLVILASYSGETEETLSSFLDAYKRGCMMFCVSSGGALIKYAKKLGVPYIEVKAGMPPRAAMPHMLMPLVKILQELNQTPTTVTEELTQATTLLETVSEQNAPEKHAKENFAKNLATQLNGLTPVIYGFGIYRGVALRWKQQFNENSKVPAKWEYFSELNHNETMGWEGAQKQAKGYGIVLFREQDEPVEIHSRIVTTKSLMQPSVDKIFEVWTQGQSALAKMLSTSLVGDFTSIYLALLRNVDPTPVNTVEIMKQKIEENGFKKNVLAELEKLSKHVLVV